MNQTTRKSLEQVVEECGRYPLEAFEFVRQGLNHTVQQIHGDTRAKSEAACHVTGQQLCQGLRNYAIKRYGTMAQAVLNHWQIHRTGDFGRIVFVMVDSKLMHKTDDDDLRDFEAVFDFDSAFHPPRGPLQRPQLFSVFNGDQNPAHFSFPAAPSLHGLALLLKRRLVFRRIEPRKVYDFEFNTQVY